MKTTIKIRTWVLAATFVLGGLVGGLTIMGSSHFAFGKPAPAVLSTEGRSNVLRTPLAGFAPVVKQALPAVVNISSSKVIRSTESESPFSNGPFSHQFFGDLFPQFQVPREHWCRGTSFWS